MKWTGLNDLREKYLSFFESKGHLRLQSFPLIPRDDKSLLLINSGMAPMKKYFTGEVTPPRKRVTTCQKCIRTPDIERVGITARHGTYFEMLGNFSFGDYFKHEATAWAWEFCTQVLEMPKDKIWISIYENDEQTKDIWTKEVGVDESHIVKLGKEDNFWEHGSGPCGPCSELYFDRGEKYGCGLPTCGVGCDCDRYVEFWNLVFTQFDNDGNGNYTPLAHPNIDTGMGLERLACIMQGVDNLFLVDTVQNIMKKVSELTGVQYGNSEKTDISLRVITDHIRSTTFMIGDGVMPSNEGRGYVLRRLLRRAARHGKILGIRKPFLYKVCETVINENKLAYPELEDKKELITKVIMVEEENFSKTIDQGMQLLSQIIEKAETASIISGEDAFKLNDTFGFPIDLTKEIVAEKGLKIDEEGFYRLLQEQKIRAKSARKNAGADAWLSESTDLSGISATKFLGYEQFDCDAKVVGIIKNGERVEFAGEGDEIVLVLDQTTFYAESGGQIGDTGIIKTASAEINVKGTVKDHSGIFLHHAVIANGTIECNENVKVNVNSERRMAIMRNHTSAHILQASLRKILGTHIEQAGQLVDEERVRFDFTHFSALTTEELAKVEQLVNEIIFKAIKVTIKEMPIEEAKKLGAMALFGEKYGDIVRVVSVGDFSIEFCGGTHIDNTSKIGLFKIVSENSVASGIRRIEAVTGTGVLRLLNNSLNSISNVANILKINNVHELIKGCEILIAENKRKDKEIESLTARIANSNVETLFRNSKLEKGIRIIMAAFSSTTADELRSMCDTAVEKAPCGVVLLVGVNDGKGVMTVCCGKEAIKRGANAGKIVKEVAKIAGGNGGGKPQMAMAGIKDLTKIDEAMLAAKDIILNMVSDEE